jgi:hypothetical protein
MGAGASFHLTTSAGPAVVVGDSLNVEQERRGATTLAMPWKSMPQIA